MRGNMGLKSNRKKWIASGLCLTASLLFAACGQTEERIQNAMGMIQSFDYQGALAELDAAIEQGENQRLVDRARGIACMGLTEYEQAIAWFLSALAGSSGLVQDVDFDLNYYLAAAYAKSGQYAQAEQTYNAILDLRQNQTDAYFLRGNVRMSLENFEGAKADFDRAVSMEPQNYDMLIEIYEVLANCGHEETGRAYLQAALEAGRDKMSGEVAGRIYYYLGEYEKACLALEEAKEKGKETCYLYLGRAYEATGDYNYAASVYNGYLNANDGSAELYNQLGLCEMARGDYQKALEAFQAGMRLEENPILQTLSFNEIVAYEYLGDYEKAAALLHNYLNNYPDDDQAKREYGFLSTR